MRSMSRFTIGLMLGAAMIATPVIAKDKKEKAAPAPKMSKEFATPAIAAQDAVKAGTFDVAKAKLAEAEAAAKTPDEIYNLNLIRLNLGISVKDEAIKRAAVDGMIASGAAPATELPKYNFYAGQFAMEAKDYDKAIPALQKAIDLGYPGSGSELLLAEANFQKAIALSADAKGQLTPAAKPFAIAGLPHLKRAIEIEKAAGTAVPAAWYNRGFTMAYTGGSPDASQWAMMNVDASPSATSWRQLLRGFQDRNRQLTRGENLDVLRLMYQTGSLDSEYDYAEYVDTASKTGLLGEVKAVIDQGRSKGKLAPTKLADYYQQATGGIAQDKASLPSSETAAAKAATGKVAAVTADAYMGYGEYAKAAALYRIALQKGTTDAGETNTRLGMALALSGDVEGAKAAFGAVTTGARKEIAQFWTLWLSKKATA